MHAFISQPWPWYVSGLAIAFIMILLIFFGKTFGFSANLSNICSMLGAGRAASFFKFDWKQEQWNLWFLVGSVVGGYISVRWLADPEPMQIASATVADLQRLHIPFDGKLEPAALFNWQFLFSGRGLLMFLGGGFLIGFGTRYAGGCTSGHAITGLSDLQWPSLVAVIGFFIGGLLMTHLLFPLIFG
jgi:uncharacterized membrane protein YedE/YeeE